MDGEPRRLCADQFGDESMIVDAPTTSHRANVIQDFARSELFDRTFQEGMDLVEETAGYLDGSGRQESKLLSRNAALAYAAESMRLTTRLMQVASWLLVQRAVREGDMPADNACDERYRLGAEGVSRGGQHPEDLPKGLLNLLERSERLYERVRHLDRRMYVEDPQTEAPNAVASQLDRLRSAFGG
jgi:regulator of CtrA degradation